eukprot:1059665-Prymnesium_polylepis.1
MTRGADMHVHARGARVNGVQTRGRTESPTGLVCRHARERDETDAPERRALPPEARRERARESNGDESDACGSAVCGSGMRQPTPPARYMRGETCLSESVWCRVGAFL